MIDTEERIADLYQSVPDANAYLGDVSVDEILEKIEDQFNDYINLPDNTNYIEMFHQYMYYSYQCWRTNETEEFPQDFVDALDRILIKFTEKMRSLFSERLNLQITLLEDDKPFHPSLLPLLTQMYDFFILNARNNFKTMIIKALVSIKPINFDEVLDRFSPFFIYADSDTFLSTLNPDLYQRYINGEFSGNYLLKYSPKLYQNKDLYAECIGEATEIIQLLNDSKEKGE